MATRKVVLTKRQLHHQLRLPASVKVDRIWTTIDPDALLIQVSGDAVPAHQDEGRFWHPDDGETFLISMAEVREL